MAAGKNLYAVVLTFSGEIEKVFEKLREDFQPHMNYTVVPHITLVYPFVPVFSFFRINEQLTKVAKRTKHFKIVLNGIEFFEDGNNVAYAAVQNRRTVKRLHTDIVKSLEGLFKEWYTDGRFNFEKFVPHVTIGERIPATSFPDVKKKLSRYKLHYEDHITDFSLFAEDNGNWQLNRVYELKGGTGRR
jgi:2'-5' RNA ligase